jgi:16S rRNA (adenine1518-N6/adenine1519-N6)-dimethyltransferase
VERDERFRPALDAIAARYPGRLDLHFRNAVGVSWGELLRQAGAAAKPAIVANLPYNVATVLLAGWLESEPWPPWYSQMALMFQKEVAERVVAEPGTKAYGRLAVLAQWRTRPRLALTLPPDAFTPPPAVASAVVDFRPIERPRPECTAKSLTKVTAAAFGQRRKMLRQSIKSIIPDPQALLSAAGLQPTSRGEELSVSDFARLAYVLDRWPR